MSAKYSINENFFIAKSKQSNSWTWNCILKNRDQFRKGIQWKARDGTNLNFWLDNWCVNDSLANLLNITNSSLIDTSLKVSHFITGNKDWDVARLQALVDPVQLQLIITIRISFNLIPDSVC